MCWFVPRDHGGPTQTGSSGSSATATWTTTRRGTPPRRGRKSHSHGIMLAAWRHYKRNTNYVVVWKCCRYTVFIMKCIFIVKGFAAFLTCLIKQNSFKCTFLILLCHINHFWTAETIHMQLCISNLLEN